MVDLCCYLSSRDFELRILNKPSEYELEFELIGVDASFANALRRILLSEVHTMAIEKVYMWDNTSMIHDEVLAHRLGLVPFNVDSRFFDEFPVDEEEDGDGSLQQEESQRATDRNTLVFRLSTSCERPGRRSKGAEQKSDEAPDSVLGPDDLVEVAAQAASTARIASQNSNLPHTKNVYSGDLEWAPQGEQEQRFPDGIRPVHDDILLAKLRPGQSIELEAHAYRGIGKDHAKYSPVATACYRLMPRIEIVKPVYDSLAEELVHLYEPGVFSLVETDKDTDPPGTSLKAAVSNPYACTMSRNFMRNPTLKESIRMTRIPDHFVFSIESVGMADPGVLVAEALRVLQGKCTRIAGYLDEDGYNEADEETDTNL